jgi:hypothetical protein
MWLPPADGYFRHVVKHELLDGANEQRLHVAVVRGDSVIANAYVPKRVVATRNRR